MAVLIVAPHPMNGSYNYRQAEFLTSAHTLAQLPVDKGREIAFAGRSNSGKSSVLNILTDHKGLARTSKTPGRTQTMNIYVVGDGVRLLDLPGYGFARVSQKLREHWAHTLNRYFMTRLSLSGLVLITDIRRELSGPDRVMLEWCEAAGLPVHVLLNKADKLSHGAASRVLNRIERESRSCGASVQLFSVLKKSGVEELSSWMDHCLRVQNSS